MKYIGISLALIFLSFVGALTPIRDGFIRFVSPMQFGMRQIAVSVKNTYIFYSSIRDIRNENISLIEKVGELETEITQLKRLEEENKLLKDQLNVVNKDSFKKDFVLANVLGNPNDLTGSTIILDRGASDGIKPGDNVIKGGFLVGIIRKVTASSSIVELLTSPNISVTVYNVNSEAKTEGLAKGEHGSSMQVERILQDEQVNIDDVFLSSGKDGIFQPGLYVGKVDDVNMDPSQPFKVATIKTVLDFSHLNRVFVLVAAGETLEKPGEGGEYP